jgi:hypothetical protein
MNNSIVPEEATGLCNLDPSKVSPVAGAIATMLANHPLTKLEAEHIAETIRRASHIHEPWCDDHESDVEGEHCARHATSYALYQDEERDWTVRASAWRGKVIDIIVDGPAMEAELSPRAAVVVLAALEHNRDAFIAALETTVEAVSA